jgi:enterochelin esterase-like enzyme
MKAKFKTALLGCCLASLSCGYWLWAQSSAATAGAWPIQPVETSPTIARLRKQLESGNQHTVESFWQDAAKNGTPLVDPSATPHHVIATFVWRDDHDTENVALLAPLVKSPGVPTIPLTRLAKTDVWYSSWEMGDDFCFSYRFVVNLKSGGNPQAPAKLDPLNPHGMELPFEGKRIRPVQFSIAVMPLAGDERWIKAQPGVPAGKLESYTFESSILARERKFSIYTPAGYSTKNPNSYALLLLFDGFSYQHWIPITTILDNLIHAQKIPPIVAVLIDTPQESRGSDLEYNPAFVGFLGDELLPWLHRRLHVTHDPQKTAIGGYSMGGTTAAFAALRRPELFGRVLSQSGSFWEGHESSQWEFLASQYDASPKLPLRFFVEAGLLEDVSKGGPTLLAANRRFVEVLKSKGYLVDYEEVGGTHEPAHWRRTLPQGLMALFK